MKYNPFKIILWMLFILVVLLNSVRLFIYGFVISFIIVIIDRAFFGTRKRSDTQFLNLFFTFTLFFAICYTFSPFFRSLDRKSTRLNSSHVRISYAVFCLKKKKKIKIKLSFIYFIYKTSH